MVSKRSRKTTKVSPKVGAFFRNVFDHAVDKVRARQMIAERLPVNVANFFRKSIESAMLHMWQQQRRQYYHRMQGNVAEFFWQYFHPEWLNRRAVDDFWRAMLAWVEPLAVPIEMNNNKIGDIPANRSQSIKYTIEDILKLKETVSTNKPPVIADPAILKLDFWKNSKWTTRKARKTLQKLNFSPILEENGQEKVNGFEFKEDAKKSAETPPEWFTGGPNSKHEIIDLHGFEDVPSVAENEKTKEPESKKDCFNFEDFLSSNGIGEELESQSAQRSKFSKFFNIDERKVSLDTGEGKRNPQSPSESIFTDLLQMLGETQQPSKKPVDLGKMRRVEEIEAELLRDATKPKLFISQFANKKQQSEFLPKLTQQPTVINTLLMPELLQNANVSPDIFLHPEAQAILNSLKSGLVSINYLIQEVQNPVVPYHRRQLYASIIKLVIHNQNCLQQMQVFSPSAQSFMAHHMQSQPDFPTYLPRNAPNTAFGMTGKPGKKKYFL